MSRPSAAALLSLLPLLLAACPDADLGRVEQRLQAAKRVDQAQAERQAVVGREAEALLAMAQQLAADSEEVAQSYARAGDAFLAAAHTAERTSEAYRSAERDYRNAAESYRLTAYLLQQAGASSPDLKRLLCKPIQQFAAKARVHIKQRVSESLDAAEQALPKLPPLMLDPPLVATLSVAGVKDPAKLKSALEARLGASALDKIRNLSDMQIDQICAATLKALGCN
jgi:hypothetical protein